MDDNFPTACDFPVPPAPLRPDAELRVIDSTSVLQGAREVLIQHGDQVYRLRVTRANRLILNK